jgi:hypothetical protein
MSTNKDKLECYIIRSLYNESKSSKMMNSRSHSMLATKTRKKMNRIKKKINGKTYHISAKGLKILNKKQLSLTSLIDANKSN